MSLEVTDVTVHPITSEDDRLLAFGSVVFEDEFVVHDMRLVRTDSRVIVAMPNERHRGEFRDVAHPLNNACRERIRRALLAEYNRQVEDAAKRVGTP